VIGGQDNFNAKRRESKKYQSEERSRGRRRKGGRSEDGLGMDVWRRRMEMYGEGEEEKRMNRRSEERV
jgi:hypothetical protein